MSAEHGWRLTKPTARAVPAGGPRADPDRNPTRVLSAIALASLAAGAINIAAAATIGRDSTQNLAFFAVVAAAQLAWGAVALARAPRWWLALGAVGNLVVVATWVVSRTVGLPVGEYAGITLPVRFPDTLATALEAVIVVGGLQGDLWSRRSSWRTSRLVWALADSRLSGERTGRGSPDTSAGQAVRRDALVGLLDTVSGHRWTPWTAAYPGRYCRPGPAESQIRQPTLIASGELDPVIPSAWTDHLGETFVDHKPALLPGIGHFVPLEVPQRATETIHRALSLAQRERGMGEDETTT